MTDPLGTDLMNAQMVTIRDLKIDPAADLTKGHRVPHPVTRFILEIKVGIVIVRLTRVITTGTVITHTILVVILMKVDTSMVFPLASMVDGVMTEGKTTGTDIGAQPMTPETDVPGEIPATGADRTIVALPTTEVMITVRVPTLRKGVIPEVAPIRQMQQVL